MNIIFLLLLTLSCACQSKSEHTELTTYIDFVSRAEPYKPQTTRYIVQIKEVREKTVLLSEESTGKLFLWQHLGIYEKTEKLKKGLIYDIEVTQNNQLFSITKKNK